jgi:hypothetical protein
MEHTLQLFMLDGQPAWTCACGITEYWQWSKEAAVRRWQCHVQAETGRWVSPSPSELKIWPKNELKIWPGTEK